MRLFAAMLLITACCLTAVQASAQEVREDPGKVLAEEFGWTIKDITKLSKERAFSRKEPYQGFNCLKNAQYLPKTDEQKATWRIGNYVCSTTDRSFGENVGAYLTLHWANLAARKPADTRELLDIRGKAMASSKVSEGYSFKIVRTKTIDNIKLDFVEYSLPFSSNSFYGASATFEHRGFRYVLIAANAVKADAITKKPWEVIEDIARRIVLLEGSAQ